MLFALAGLATYAFFARFADGGPNLLLDALVARPEEMLERCERFCDGTCKVLATDAARVAHELKLAHRLQVKTFADSVASTIKSMEAAREGFKNVSAGLDAVASLCACALRTDDAEELLAVLAEAKRGAQQVLALDDACVSQWRPSMVQFGMPLEPVKQWVDVPEFDGQRLICKFDNAAAALPRGQHSFVMHLRVATDVAWLDAFPLLPEDVSVHLSGDPSGTWAAEQHPDGCGITVTYVAAMAPKKVEIAVHAFGTVFYRQHLVSLRACVCVYVCS